MNTNLSQQHDGEISRILFKGCIQEQKYTAITALEVSQSIPTDRRRYPSKEQLRYRRRQLEFTIMIQVPFAITINVSVLFSVVFYRINFKCYGHCFRIVLKNRNVNNPHQSKKSTFKHYFSKQPFLISYILHICKHKILGGS